MDSGGYISDTGGAGHESFLDGDPRVLRREPLGPPESLHPSSSSSPPPQVDDSRIRECIASIDITRIFEAKLTETAIYEQSFTLADCCEFVDEFASIRKALARVAASDHELNAREYERLFRLRKFTIQLICSHSTSHGLKLYEPHMVSTETGHSWVVRLMSHTIVVYAMVDYLVRRHCSARPRLNHLRLVHASSSSTRDQSSESSVCTQECQSNETPCTLMHTSNQSETRSGSPHIQYCACGFSWVRRARDYRVSHNDTLKQWKRRELLDSNAPLGVSQCMEDLLYFIRNPWQMVCRSREERRSRNHMLDTMHDCLSRAVCFPLQKQDVLNDDKDIYVEMNGQERVPMTYKLYALTDDCIELVSSFIRILMIYIHEAMLPAVLYLDRVVHPDVRCEHPSDDVAQFRSDLRVGVRNFMSRFVDDILINDDNLQRNFLRKMRSCMFQSIVCPIIVAYKDTNCDLTFRERFERVSNRDREMHRIARMYAPSDAWIYHNFDQEVQPLSLKSDLLNQVFRALLNYKVNERSVYSWLQDNECLSSIVLGDDMNEPKRVLDLKEDEIHDRAHQGMITLSHTLQRCMVVEWLQHVSEVTDYDHASTYFFVSYSELHDDYFGSIKRIEAALDPPIETMIIVEWCRCQYCVISVTECRFFGMDFFGAFSHWLEHQYERDEFFTSPERYRNIERFIRKYFLSKRHRSDREHQGDPRKRPRISTALESQLGIGR